MLARSGAILGLASILFVLPHRTAAAQKPGFRPSIAAGFRALGNVISGKEEKSSPKQAARLPVPPDAHEDDALIRRLARPPIAEVPTTHNPIQPASQLNDGDSGAGEVSGPVSGIPDGISSREGQARSTDSGTNVARIPEFRSLADVASLASAVGETAERIITASLDPGHTKGIEANQPRKPAAKPRSGEAVKRAARDERPAAASSAAQGTGPRPPSNVRMDRLKRRIEQVLSVYQRRPLNTQDHTPWEVMHGFLAFGIATEVRVGGPSGGLVNAIGWLNSGGRCRGQTMLASHGDRVVALKGVGLQGHSAQYLAILAQCRVAASSPLTPQRKSFTVADLIEQEKLDCKSKTELTFALIGLAHYLPTDATWESRDGQHWSLERLVAEELEQPIRGAPCGGTHRLFGLAYGCQRRLRATGSLDDGVYARADAFVREYQLLTLTKLQNPDGSFSTEWYKFPTAQNRDDDIDRKIQTTGHMLEWLVASLDQDSLYHPRVTRAVEYLTWALASDPSREWSVGPMCHALHALSVYQERVWGTVLPGAVAAFKGPMKAAAEPEVELAEESRLEEEDRADPEPRAAGRNDPRKSRR